MQAQVSPVALLHREGLSGPRAEEFVFALDCLAERPEHRAALLFLMQHMPAADLAELAIADLLEHVDLAFEARAAHPWGAAPAEALFLNAVLPYAVLDELRHLEWRAELRALALPLIADAPTATAAVERLNERLFAAIGVRYSTERAKPNQSVRESRASGLASCSGLSIALVCACRAVGIPARAVGTPLWTKGSGNHTWVEVWTDGAWHFVGAAEPDPAGLDRGWFVGEARKAKENEPQHAIYAASFAWRQQHFPLVWAPRSVDVFADNVTRRYIDPASATAEVPDQPLPEAISALLQDTPSSDTLRAALLAHEAVVLTRAQAAAMRDAIRSWWTRWARREFGEALLVRRELRHGDLVMRWTMRRCSPTAIPPRGGHPLIISMHGGGGAPKATNDSQWQNQHLLYPQLRDGIYLCPRAPTDTWDLWHQPHMDVLLARLVAAAIPLYGINPSRVYLIGYSAGGDGAYQMGPRMADFWAGVGCFAGHPNGADPASLRNVATAVYCGALDAAYNRNDAARAFGAALTELQRSDKDGYKHQCVLPATGHWMNGAEASALPWMLACQRPTRPRRVVWQQHGSTLSNRMYWLAVDSPQGSSRIVAEWSERNVVTVREARGLVGPLYIFMDEAWCDLDAPVTVLGPLGAPLWKGVVERTVGALVRSFRGDPSMMFEAVVRIEHV